MEFITEAAMGAGVMQPEKQGMFCRSLDADVKWPIKKFHFILNSFSASIHCQFIHTLSLKVGFTSVKCPEYPLVELYCI